MPHSNLWLSIFPSIDDVVPPPCPPSPSSSIQPSLSIYSSSFHSHGKFIYVFIYFSSESRTQISKENNTGMLSPSSSKVKDPYIKLFGTMILMPLQCSVCTTHSSGPVPPSSSSSPDTSARDQDSSKIELITPEQDDGASHQTTEDPKSPTSSGVCENPKTLSHSTKRENSVLNSSKTGEESETSTQQEKTPKKPDKIIPCPRCNSKDTKFCYFNNYNVNQPRHFCKNCQRYWTAGGTMRNMPVGAGRRKNKSYCASNYRHIVIPESLITAANANGLHNTALRNGETVLTFGSDSAICDSMASVLNLAEKTQNGVLNGVHIPQQNITVPCGRADNGDDHSVGASVTTSTSSEKKANAGSQESVNKTYEGFPPQLQCIQGSPWHYPWNSLVPPPALSPGHPVSFYPPPAYCGCALPASLNIACVSPQSSLHNPSPRSISNSPTSRKHLRDGRIITQANSHKEKPDAESKDSENGVMIPKPLRIDDPTAAAKSSIRSTLGIKNGKANPFNGCVGLFKEIPSKEDDQNHHHHMVEVLPMLHVNPAALSRSVAFHEQQA